MTVLRSVKHCNSCDDLHSLLLLGGDPADSRQMYKYKCPTTGEECQTRCSDSFQVVPQYPRGKGISEIAKGWPAATR